jgi:GDP-D-mannose 3',5'-epimerase
MSNSARRALVCGAGGFIGGHLVKNLKHRGYWVRGVDIKMHDFCRSHADEFLLLDLRREQDCAAAVRHPEGQFDEVYQLAADMGGMGFIQSAACEIMRNNSLINTHMIQAAAAQRIQRYFFSSSVCVYRDMRPGEPELSEEGAIPACPDNEYGWEKLYTERMLAAYQQRYGVQVRIARFQNCYGPEGTWRGGREKAPAAICRKVAEVDNGGSIEVWGDGTAIRSYTHVDDMIEGVYCLMQSGISGPVNIGCPEYVSVRELVSTVAAVAGKEIRIKYVDGPVGVQSRNFSNSKIYSLGWRAAISLREGIKLTYPWVEAQVRSTCNGSVAKSAAAASDGLASVS